MVSECESSLSDVHQDVHHRRRRRRARVADDDALRAGDAAQKPATGVLYRASVRDARRAADADVSAGDVSSVA